MIEYQLKARCFVHARNVLNVSKFVEVVYGM